MLAEDLLVGTPDIPQTAEQRTLETDEVIKILNVADESGSPIPAVFTSQERLAACFGYGTGYLAMNGETLFGILSEGGAVLNPGSAYGVQWTQDQLAALLGKPVRRTIKKDTKVLLGSPSERPEKLIRQLTEVFESDPRILEAWLALAHWPNDNTMTWYLDVRSQSKPDDISSTIARAVNGTELTDKPIDVVVNLPSASEGTGVRIKPTSLH